MTSIFISYRHDDALVEAEALYTSLRRSIPSASVFLYLDLLPRGQDFSSTIQKRIVESESVIVVIGPNWLAATDMAGHRRLEDQADFVRREIEWALRMRKRVVPVLVRGAEMPRADALPASLEPLTRINALVLRSDHLETDTREVIGAVRGERPLRPQYAHGARVTGTAIFTFSMALALTVSPVAKALIPLSSQITKSISALLSDRALVDLLLSAFLGMFFVVSAAAIVGILYANRQMLVAGAFGWWTWLVGRKLVYGWLGPGWGSVEGPIDESMLRDALPSEYPPGHGPQDNVYPESSGSREDHLRRAAAWASYLNEVAQNDKRFCIPSRKGITSFGFMSVAGGRLQLGVIVYLSPLRAFLAVADRSFPVHIPFGDWRFPVIVRPWLPVRHGSRLSFGNCWVRCPQGQHGVLTARHAVRPKRLGKSVSIDVERAPRRGQLLSSSVMMDAAVIALSINDWGGNKSVSPSSVIGYKPVRLLSMTGAKNGQVMEVSSTTIWAERGREPLNGNILFFNPSLQPGDSGCLVLDCEHQSQPPYLMYLGKTTLNGGRSYGYGVLLEQARLIWDLEFFT